MTHRYKQRIWRLFLYCFVCFAAAFAATLVDAAPAPVSRTFWVADSNQEQRQTTATLRASGRDSLLYVEDSLFNQEVTSDLLSRLAWQLESEVPAGAYETGEGLLTLEQTIFRGAFPRISEDKPLIVLFTAGGPYGDGAFDPRDQLSDEEALRRFERHSNEADVIYLNGLAKLDEPVAAGVVAREYQKLLAYKARPAPREKWLADSLALGAELLAGYFGDQPRVEQYLNATGRFPLVTPGSGQGGPQLLFAYFLIDSLPQAHDTALGTLNEIDRNGRDAVELLFVRQTQVPLNFDAIFSNFVSYIFKQAEGAASLPSSWRHSPGLQVPFVASYATYKNGSGELNGHLAPYSFVAIDLERPLSPSAVLQLQRAVPLPGTAITDCATNASVLWKPVSPTRIAVYAVGCDPSDKEETVDFLLKIVDQPTHGSSNILR